MADHEGRNGALYHGQNSGQRPGIIGEQEAQGERKGKYPLPDRRLGEHVIDQVSGRFEPCSNTGVRSDTFLAETKK